jgi:hypothetical protein
MTQPESHVTYPLYSPTEGPAGRGLGAKAAPECATTGASSTLVLQNGSVGVA